MDARAEHDTKLDAASASLLGMVRPEERLGRVAHRGICIRAIDFAIESGSGANAHGRRRIDR